jgi:hypothetical protein
LIERRAPGEKRTRRNPYEARTAALPNDDGLGSGRHGVSIINFIFNDHFPFPNGPEGAFVHLGFPEYFKIELTIAKILGVLALLIPAVPFKLKEFAYFGFAITLISASIAHFGRGDTGLSVLIVVDPLVFLGLLTISYFYFVKSRSLRRTAV